jgi:protochlorophyllide reductase
MNCNLDGRIAVVTGATGGLGREITKMLLKLNAKVIMAVRNIKKAEEFRDSLISCYDVNNIDIIKLELSSLKETKLFINKLKEKYEKIDILINNAGMYNLPVKINNDGIEQHIAINFINTVYLTEELLSLLKPSSFAKVIFISSISSDFYSLKKDNNLNFKNKMKAYGISKKLLNLTVLKLKNSMESDSKIKFNIVHPGICATDIVSKNNGGSFFLANIAKPLMKVFFNSPEKSALNILFSLCSDIPYGYWAGPEYFRIWGRPKLIKLKNEFFIIENQNYSYELYKSTLNKIEKKAFAD